MAMASAKEAIRLVERIMDFDPEMLEQPMPAHDLPAMAEIRRSVSLPIMADESVASPLTAMEVIRREAADVLNVYVVESGGIQNAARIFTLAEQAGLGCMIGSMPELGIGTAAQIHLGIAMPNLDFDSDACGSLYQEEDLLATPLRLDQGFAYAPEGPGLGVALDPIALRTRCEAKSALLNVATGAHHGASGASVRSADAFAPLRGPRSRAEARFGPEPEARARRPRTETIHPEP